MCLLNSIENFFITYQHTFQALGAIATLAAVIVSLWLSRKEPEKITATVSVSIIIGTGIKSDDVITVHIKNTGFRVVYIPEFFFSFKIPFSKTAYALKPSNLGTIQLVPGKSQTLELITVPAFQSEFKRCFKEIKPLFRGFRLGLIKAYITTEAGYEHRAKLAPSFKSEVSNLIDSLGSE